MAKKDCFGILDRVFPVGDQGLREVPPTCFQCPERTECLKAALATQEGVSFRMELLDRRSPRGFVERLKRWSERKALSRSMEQRKDSNHDH
ncbi:MAG: hypothetical protein JRH08_03595 [Deltaproteobacteria bacterium]|nr:hypothetical protein [Deltaproteobacteria bacterium]MBW1927920.1 hypothetical protein [Deltaproteobacteria bacterium]MBW2024839.1 hypothetical protein [Deltaproteobacteria bacterium]MBW2124783.1 hypothetical protein [Deltaproteobacteria bacterium]RLB19878.1 MAG: hypothetical protein DRG63_00175 [Deltaproteobacteria bacterium]